jgi:pimeloyl-ACP methyl ester carboxylesterase
MTTFVLVHGAWHGGWYYKQVARLLRQAGHEVYTPTLTGLGERAHLMNRTIDLDTHVQDIVGVIRCEELSDVVLCGHSYGGMVIAGVAEQVAAKIRSLVYLDAFVPENGKSLFDYLPAEQSGQMRTDAAQNGEGYKVTPIPAAAFAVNAYGDKEQLFLLAFERYASRFLDSVRQARLSKSPAPGKNVAAIRAHPVAGSQAPPQPLVTR